MLGNPSAGAQRRAAHAVADLADNNPGSPGIIVNAGAISPLVNLVSLGVTQVKVEAAGAGQKRGDGREQGLEATCERRGREAMNERVTEPGWPVHSAPTS